MYSFGISENVCEVVITRIYFYVAPLDHNFRFSFVKKEEEEKPYKGRNVNIVAADFSNKKLIHLYWLEDKCQ